MNIRAGRKTAVDSKADALLLLPRAYLDNSTVTTVIEELPEAVPGVIRLTLRELFMAGAERARLQLRFEDARGTQVDAAVFGDFRRLNDIKVGDVLLVRAKRGSYGGYPQLRNRVPITTGDAVQPVYAPGWKVGNGEVKKVTGETVAKNIAQHLQSQADGALQLIEQACGMPRAAIAELVGVTSLERWLKAVHMPATMKEAHAAKKVASRIGLLESIVKAQQNALRPDTPRSRIDVNAGDALELVKQARIIPTGAQRRAIESICASLNSTRALRAMVTGDVGTQAGESCGVFPNQVISGADVMAEHGFMTAPWQPLRREKPAC